MNILYVEDSKTDAVIFSRMATLRGHDVTNSTCASETYGLLQDNDFDLAIVDYNLPDTVCEELGIICSRFIPRVIFLSSERRPVSLPLLLKCDLQNAEFWHAIECIQSDVGE